jgi:hypothetical protein
MTTMTRAEAQPRANTLGYATPHTGADERGQSTLLALEICALLFSLPGAALMLWGARLPVSNWSLMFVGGLAWIIAGLCLLVVFSVESIRAITRRPRVPASRRRWILRLAPVLLFLLLMIVLGLELPRRMMFAANRSALDAWARQVLASGTAPPPTAVVGGYDLFEVELIPRGGGGVRCLVGGTGGFRYAGGFAYTPNSAPPPVMAAQDSYTPLGGGWYAREYDGG